MTRTLEPEWLDSLPAADPRARRSRRDLRRVNALMSNAGIVARELRRDAPGLAALAEIGAGDGEFALRLARALPVPPRGASLVLLDQQSIVEPATLEALALRGWSGRPVQDDVFAWLSGAGAGGQPLPAPLR